MGRCIGVLAAQQAVFVGGEVAGDLHLGMTAGFGIYFFVCLVRWSGTLHVAEKRGI